MSINEPLLKVNVIDLEFPYIKLNPLKFFDLEPVKSVILIMSKYCFGEDDGYT